MCTIKSSDPELGQLVSAKKVQKPVVSGTSAVTRSDSLRF
jgi:hypothetical protein